MEIKRNSDDSHQRETANYQTDEFIEIRCRVCNKFICEISTDATGRIRRKCEKCKHPVKISLPISQKVNTILAGR